MIELKDKWLKISNDFMIFTWKGFNETEIEF